MWNSDSGRSCSSSCPICFVEKPNREMIQIDDDDDDGCCSHRYCSSCMKKHVELQLLNAVLPKCPSHNCKSKLKLETCKLFLPSNLLLIMAQRLKEASIPVTERVYCPFPKCSALMSNSEGLKKNVGREEIRGGARRCVKCCELFCVNCKVAWHGDMSCSEYRNRMRNNPDELAKLKALADDRLWRQCRWCDHMIERSHGCNHVICRCGFGFCYLCCAEWKMGNAKCSCPVWNEENIIYN